MIQKFYSNGKLLITGEYVVLDGAAALALPTKFGQSLEVQAGKSKNIEWTSFDADNTIWFQDTISFEEIQTKKTSEKNSKVKNTLLEILHQAFLQNTSFLDDSDGYCITTHLTFPRLWGLGTSSTLINNIGQWLQIDAFELLYKSFGGSGYDVACAQNNKPIIYQLKNEKPVIKEVVFDPKFKENIHFVYLNRKQSSKQAISNYITNQNNAFKIIPAITEITQNSLVCENARDFAFLMEKHQVILSNLLETETVKEMLFPDFKGIIKSLGAWGGDFAMVIAAENPVAYFESQGYNTILTYQEMIL